MKAKQTMSTSAASKISSSSNYHSLISNKLSNSPKLLDIRGEDIFPEYYEQYYDNMSSKELDIEFNNDLQILVKTLRKLPDSERKVIIDLLSGVIEFYMEHKIEKEINLSFKKILKF